MFYNRIKRSEKMKIGELSKRSQTTIDTIRYYEKLGLIIPDRTNYQKEYSESDLELLALIATFKSVGFKLNELQLLMTLERKYLTLEQILSMEKKDLDQLTQLIISKQQEIAYQKEAVLRAEQLLSKIRKKLEVIK